MVMLVEGQIVTSITPLPVQLQIPARNQPQTQEWNCDEDFHVIHNSECP